MTSPNAPRPAEVLLATLAFLLVAAGNVGSLWSVDYLPTHDGPQDFFTLHVANHLDDPDAGYGDFLRPGLPITHYGFAFLYAPLDRWLPWLSAYRIALTGVVLLWCAGAMALAGALHPRRVWLGIPLAALAFQWSLYMGFFSFHVATSLGLLILAYAVAKPAWHTRKRVLLAGLLLAQALAHIFPAILTGLLLVVLALARMEPRRWPGELARCAAMGLPAATIAVAILAAAGDQAALTVEPGAAGAAWVAEWPGPRLMAKCFASGPPWRVWAPLLLALGVALHAPVSGWASRRSEDRVLLMAGVALLLCAFALPLHLPGWEFFSPRFLPMALCCLVLVLPLERLEGSLRYGAAVAALVALALASTLWAAAYNRELGARSAPALAGLEAPLRRSGPRLPMVMDPLLGRPLEDADAWVPYAAPLLNLGQIYATEQGGMPAHTFAVSRPTHHVLLRDDPVRPFPAYPSRTYPLLLAREGAGEGTPLRRKLTTYVASHGVDFEDVILWGLPADAELLLERGYVADWRSEGLMLAHFEGCPVQLAIEARDAGVEEARAPDTLLVELGLGELCRDRVGAGSDAAAAARLSLRLHLAARQRRGGEPGGAGATLELSGLGCRGTPHRARYPFDP